MVENGAAEEETGSIQEQLERAVRDLWSMLEDSGPEYVVFTDRRRLHTRVEHGMDGMYHVSWEPNDDSGVWIEHADAFDQPREAAFHGYQGPH